MTWNFDPKKRLWPYVKKGAKSECWEWQRATTRAGYGMLTIQYKSHYAHRLAWELSNGPIPDGLFVCHACDNPTCCNPNHLYLATNEQNILDMWEKGRGSTGERHISNAKLTPQDVCEIRAFAEKIPPNDLAQRYDVSITTIHNIIRGNTWKHLI